MVEETAGTRRWVKVIPFVYALLFLGALWALWRYLTGDGSLGAFLFRALFLIGFIPMLRAPQQHMIKADSESVFLPGSFRWHRIPWTQVSEVRLDTPQPWTSAVLVITDDGRTRKAPVVQDVESFLAYWREVRQTHTDD